MPCAVPDWLSPDAIPRAPSPEPVREPQDGPEEQFFTDMQDAFRYGDVAKVLPPLPDMIRLDALAGPLETMQAAGFTNRGSLAYAMKERDFPAPVKVLRGIRLWDLDQVEDWVRDHPVQTSRNRTEP